MVTTFSSCKKFLEEPVDNRTLITTISDMEKTLNTLLPYSDHHFTDLMTDDYIFRDLSGHNVESSTEPLLPIFEFAITRQSMPADKFLQSGFNPATAFRRYYYRIINSFLIIERAESVVPGSAEERARINAIIGKAKAIKAYCNYMLVSLFGKQYNPATAETDMSIPLIESYNGDAVVPYPKASVKKIFDLVEADLLEALPLLRDTETENAKFTFTKDAVYAFLTRLYLNKKDWDNTIKYADLLLARRSVPLNNKQIRTSITDYAQYSSTYFNPSNESYILMGNNTYQLLAYFWHGMYPYPAVQLLRDNAADPANNYVIITSPLMNDYVPQKLMNFYTPTARSFNLPLFTVDEVYFNRAEASIEKNNGMTNTAKNDLDLLMRNQNYSTAGLNTKINQLNALSTRAASINFLLLLKRIRFMSEGMRWFDMKRHNIPVTHVGRTGTYTIDGTDPNAYVMQLPLEEITRNSGL
ncbi:MAG: RagB/SusD family nutrient uptake outer membrane protein [Bacteroidota bacterium]|nr:RagB/SusD family nutrient uptake outer membrane protein [Bacteroidota bacterium]